MPNLRVLDVGSGAGTSGRLNSFFEEFIGVAKARHGSLREICMFGRIEETFLAGCFALGHLPAPQYIGADGVLGPALLQLFESHSDLRLILNSNSISGGKDLILTPGTAPAVLNSRGRPIRLLFPDHLLSYALGREV